MSDPFFLDQKPVAAQSGDGAFFLDDAPAEANSAGGAFVQGIIDTPQTLMQMPGALYDMGKDVAQTAISPIDAVQSGQAERALRQVGGLSAGIAGAGSLGTAGAAVGSILGPIGTAAGGLLGGGVGFGAGLLGFNKLLQATGTDPETAATEDLNTLAYNSGQGIGGAGILKGGGALARSIKLPGALRNAATDLEAGALNINRTDVKMSRKYEAKGAAGEDAPLYRALEGTRERGMFKGDKSPEALAAKNQAAIEAGGQVVESLLGKIDDAKAEPVVPDFSRTAKFIEEAAPGTRATLKAQFERFQEEFAQRWDGSLTYLNDTKKAIARKAYSGLTDSKDLDKAIAADLRLAVERGVEQYGGKETAQLLRDANKTMGEHLTLRNVLQKGKDISEATGSLSTALRRATVSPLSIPGAAVAGALAGGSGYAVPAAVLGSLLYALNTTRGRFAAGSALRGTAGALEGAPGHSISPSIVLSQRASEKSAPVKVSPLVDALLLEQQLLQAQ